MEVTRGSIWVAGYNMTTQMPRARAHIGLCSQHNVLFNELTVREHLEFFARLKGFSGRELDEEIDKLIDKLEMQEKVMVDSNYLILKIYFQEITLLKLYEQPLQSNLK